MKNWKTTLIGFLGALWVVAQPIISKGDFEITRDWKSLVGALLLASFGLLVKDHNVTGGTVVNTPNSSIAVTEAATQDKV